MSQQHGSKLGPKFAFLEKAERQKPRACLFLIPVIYWGGIFYARYYLRRGEPMKWGVQGGKPCRA